MAPTFSIIIPTVGRPELDRTLLSCLTAGLTSSDEVLVIGDGPQGAAERMVRKWQPAFPAPLWHFFTEKANDWGCTPRNVGIGRASKDFLMFIDDDDEYVIGAFDMIREVTRSSTVALPIGLYWSPNHMKMVYNKVYVFRMMSHTRPWGELWTHKNIENGNVGTPMFCVPNYKARLGLWTPRYIGDLDFIKSTVALYPNQEKDIVWRPEIIAKVH